MRLVLALLAMWIGLAFAGEPVALRIVILGDSTVCDYPAQSDTRGWGQFLADGFATKPVVRNLAAGGRSTKTFIREGRLDKALAEPADIALIQFGHNDSHGKDRPESTDAATDYSENLRIYIDAFQKAGVQPILVTPMHRRTFVNGKPSEELRPYAEAMKAVATEKKIPLVDLYTRSGELFEKRGEDASVELNCNAKDRTHFSEKGAKAMANLVLEELVKIDARVKEAVAVQK